MCIVNKQIFLRTLLNDSYAVYECIEIGGYQCSLNGNVPENLVLTTLVIFDVLLLVTYIANFPASQNA